MPQTLHMSFEQLLKLSLELPIPATDAARDIKWCDNNHVLGLSRQPGGGIELFLSGSRLRCQSPLVRRHLLYERWARAGGDMFRANRIVFPPEEYYIPATAFLAEELLRRGISTSLANSFAETEPLIEMMLRRLGPSEDELLGLLGELRFLEALLTSADDTRERTIALDSWRGHDRGVRDFCRGSISAEIKTTVSRQSRHHINNVGQVDPRSFSNREPEQLFLISIGLQPCVGPPDDTNSFSLPSQVDSILRKLAQPEAGGGQGELQTLFLEKVFSYGNSGGRGYDHQKMRHWGAYANRWTHRFLRIYDLADPDINVLRREDIRRRAHVVFDSVRFEIDLPEHVSGDLNPQTDPFALARLFLR